MSGQAGAALEGEHYSIFIGSGMNVSVQPPPGDDGSFIGRYFEKKSKPYREWLARAQPKLDALFRRLIEQEGLPIVPLGKKFSEVQGVIVEDGHSGREAELARHFARHRGQGPWVVRLSGRDMPDHGSLEMHFLVSDRVRRSLVESIVARVTELLVETRA